MAVVENGGQFLPPNKITKLIARLQRHFGRRAIGIASGTSPSAWRREVGLSPPQVLTIRARLKLWGELRTLPNAMTAKRRHRFNCHLPNNVAVHAHTPRQPHQDTFEADTWSFISMTDYTSTFQMNVRTRWCNMLQPPPPEAGVLGPEWLTEETWKTTKDEMTSRYSHEITLANASKANQHKDIIKMQYGNLITRESDIESAYDPPAYMDILENNPDDIYCLVQLRTGGSSLHEHQRARFTAIGIEEEGLCHRQLDSTHRCEARETFRHALHECQSDKCCTARIELHKNIKAWCRNWIGPARKKLPLQPFSKKIPDHRKTWEGRRDTDWTDLCLGAPPIWPKTILMSDKAYEKHWPKDTQPPARRATDEWRKRLRTEWLQFLRIVTTWARRHEMLQNNNNSRRKED